KSSASDSDLKIGDPASRQRPDVPALAAPQPRPATPPALAFNRPRTLGGFPKRRGRESMRHVLIRGAGSMSAIEITRQDLSILQLRAEAGRTTDAKQARRILAIALVLDGHSRLVAAQARCMDRQTLRGRVHRYNADGLAGLADRPRQQEQKTQPRAACKRIVARAYRDLRKRACSSRRH